MSKITLNNVADLTQTTTAATTINTNSSTVQTAFDNTLSRDGTSPNQMGAALDMNNQQIINLPTPSSVNSPARLIDVVSNPTIVVPGTGTTGHVVPFLDGNNTWSGTQTFSTDTFNGNTTFAGNVTHNGTTTFTNTVTLPAGSVTSSEIATNGVTNTQLAQMSLNTIKGNNTGGTANAADLTVSQVNTLLGTVSLSANNIYTGNQYVKNGFPWADIIAWGADPTGTADSTAAIQNAINYLVANTGGGGTVYVPPGLYKTTGPITVKFAVRIVGASREVCLIGNAAVNGNVFNFDTSCNYAALEQIFVQGYTGAGPTANTVSVAFGVPVMIKDCHIVGGAVGLLDSGGDGTRQNCNIVGAVTNVSIVNGANWYHRIKMDSSGVFGPSTNALLISNTVDAENGFIQCDFSITGTNALNINDTGTHSIAIFQGCVFGANVTCGSNAKFNTFTGCEFGTTITCGTTPSAFSGCIGVNGATVITGAGKTLAACINLT